MGQTTSVVTDNNYLRTKLKTSNTALAGTHNHVRPEPIAKRAPRGSLPRPSLVAIALAVVLPTPDPQVELATQESPKRDHSQSFRGCCDKGVVLCFDNRQSDHCLRAAPMFDRSTVNDDHASTVDLRDRRHAMQPSVNLNRRRWTCSSDLPRSYVHTSFGCFNRYLAVRIVRASPLTRRFAICLHASFDANCKSILFSDRLFARTTTAPSTTRLVQPWIVPLLIKSVRDLFLFRKSIRAFGWQPTKNSAPNFSFVSQVC